VHFEDKGLLLNAINIGEGLNKAVKELETSNTRPT